MKLNINKRKKKGINKEKLIICLIKITNLKN